MTEQLSFVQKIRKRRRKLSTPENIATRLEPLADFYRTQKPNQKSMHISKDDAWSLREARQKDETERTNECGMAGFHFMGQNIEWRGFDLIETE